MAQMLNNALPLIQGMTMKLLLDNLFFLGEVASLAAVLWGAWLVMFEAPGRYRFPRLQKFRAGRVVHG